MSTEIASRVEAVRRFNRFYTGRIGVLREGVLRSPFTLTEARVVYEIGSRGETTASELAGELGLDAGYLSRILARLQRGGLVQRERSTEDARRYRLRLTESGAAALGRLAAESREEVAGMLAALAPGEQERLIEAMGAIEGLLAAPAARDAPFVLRPHQPGDLGWVTHRHGVLYAREYGWGGDFEALVAEVAAGFLKEHDPARERCWIAEREGEIVGSVCLVRHPDRPDVAKLRLLLVEPSARGLGLGTALVEECIRFAREAGYRRIALWTNSVLRSARRIYEGTGFALVHREPNRVFGEGLVSETWEREL